MRLVRPICGVLALALACAAGLLLARSVGGATGGPTAPTLILPTTRLGPALTLPFRPPPIFTRPRPGVFVLPQPVGQVVPGFPVAVGEVLFVSSRDGAPEIYQMHATGAGQTRL